MMRLNIHFLTMILLMLALGACAPENLDITPTATATNTPTATATPNIAATATAQAAAANTNQEDEEEHAEEIAAHRAFLDRILAEMPSQINAGATQWRKTNDPTFYVELEEGITGRINYNEPGGGQSELTFGVFDTPELATAHWERTRGNLRTLENATTREDFTQRNAFGGGTYGADAIFVWDNVFLRVSVPRFSSTAGNPLLGYSREIFRHLDTIIPAGS